MRNISQAPSKYIMRTYDLKGSTYDRQVLKQPGIYSSQQRQIKKTLKDTDFDRLESVVHCPGHMKAKLCNVLKQDSLFFKKNGLIDYSLLLVIVEWDPYCKDNNVTIEDVKNKFSNPIYMVEHIKEHDKKVYYHMAVIDYLQMWNNQKKTEQTFKRLITMSMDTDTSAQDPDIYSKRFIDEVANKLFEYGIDNFAPSSYLNPSYMLNSSGDKSFNNSLSIQGMSDNYFK